MQIDKMNFDSKKGWKKSFSYETKAPLSFILTKRMSFWFPIMKRKEIITWIRVYPNWQTNFNDKKWCEVNLFLWNQSINSFVPMKRMNLWCLIIKEKRLLCEFAFIPIEKWTLILKMVERRVFLMKPKHQYH